DVSPDEHAPGVVCERDRPRLEAMMTAWDQRVDEVLLEREARRAAALGPPIDLIVDDDGVAPGGDRPVRRQDRALDPCLAFALVDVGPAAEALLPAEVEAI